MLSIYLFFSLICLYLIYIYYYFFIFLSIVLIGLFFIDLYYLFFRKKIFIQKLIFNYKIYLPLILFTAYLQGIVHEGFNFFVKEWIYINWPLQNIVLFEVPIIVFIFGWLGLVIGPLIIFEVFIKK
jgi:hypothetical protein